MSFWTQAQDFIVKKIFRHNCGEVLDYYNQHIIKFALAPTPEGKTMLVGDSITEGWTNPPRGIMPLDVINYGIAGDTSTGVRKRIEQIITAKPAKVILNIGVNDLNSDQAGSLAVNYPIILSTIQNALPDCKVYCCSMRYMNVKLNPDFQERNNRVTTFNRILEGHALTKGMTWVDVNVAVAPEGFLKLEYTEDGIHLNQDGYFAEWEILKTLV